VPKERLKAKRVSESAVTTVRLMMPTDGNIMGNVFGGSIDRMNFLAPVYVGNILILKASVNYVGKTSMEIGVRIEAQDPLTGKVVHTGSCYLTYVALDDKGRPTPVPKIIPETPEEKRRYREGLARRKMREAEIAALKQD
jgi:acyl-CoA hydrolase